MRKQYKNMKNNASDEFQTPEIAIRCLLPYLPKYWVIWECAWGGGSLAGHLLNSGYEVIGFEFMDFFSETYYPENYDAIVTNPPYTLKDEFLAHCYELGKPFALLMPLSALEGKRRGALYREHGIQLIIPNKRITFITPTGKSKETGSSAWYQTAWFTRGLHLPKDLMFVDL